MNNLIKRKRIVKGINIIISNGKIPDKCFEVVGVKRFVAVTPATAFYERLSEKFDTVYMCKTKQGFMVEFKTYVSDFETASLIKEEVDRRIGEILLEI